MTYAILDLGGNAVAMNASGYSVGEQNHAAALWTPNGDATILQNQGGLESEAVSINILGESTGADTVSGSIQYAARWSATGQETILSDPGGEQRDSGVVINASGGVAGWSQTSYGVWDLVYWNASGKATVVAPNMDPLDGFTITGLNNAGDICCYENYEAFVYSSSGHLIWSGGSDTETYAINQSGETCGVDGDYAAVWSPTGTVTLLAQSSSINPGFGISVASAINAKGETCGWSGDDAMLWSPTGTATILNDPYHIHAFAEALNARDDSVGYFLKPNGREVAAYWTPTGAVISLGAILGSSWYDTEATAIDSNGDVLGSGNYNGEVESFLLIKSTSGTADSTPQFVESPIHHILAPSAVQA